MNDILYRIDIWKYFRVIRVFLHRLFDLSFAQSFCNYLTNTVFLQFSSYFYPYNEYSRVSLLPKSLVMWGRGMEVIAAIDIRLNLH